MRLSAIMFLSWDMRLGGLSSCEFDLANTSLIPLQGNFRYLDIPAKTKLLSAKFELGPLQFQRTTAGSLATCSDPSLFNALKRSATKLKVLAHCSR